MARVLSGLFAAGATLALLTLLLPHGSRASEVGLLGVVTSAYLTAAYLYWRADNVSRRALPAMLASGALHITTVAYFSGQAPSPLVFFYLWIFLYSAYFFSRRETAVQIVMTAVAYAGLLAVRPPETGVAAWWVVGIGTLLVAAILILSMRRRVELLIEQLFESARTDPLTKLTNRRGFREALDLDLERARRAERPMTVLVGDLDHFKDVNDRAGHHGGDLALRRVASFLDSRKRQIDTVARVGGEEFALLLPDTDAAGAFIVAEWLRTEIRDSFAGDLVPLTISFGIATFPEHGQTPAALLHAADQALYAAKESGRNRTVIHSATTRTLLTAPGGRRGIEGERFLAVLLDLAEALDLRFSGSARHCETVGRYAEMMAGELHLPEHRIGRIRLAGILHDIGKIGIPDAILRKAGPLTPDEWAAMHQHPGLGAHILEHESLADVRSWVADHHERPDGNGYPRGISGADLAIEPRILAVADAYEAMTSDRSYRSAIGPAAACAELRRGAGTQFDADATAALLRVLDRESELAGVA